MLPATDQSSTDGELAAHRERFEADPDATAAFEMLEEHLFMEQAWRELVALYRKGEQPFTKIDLGLAEIVALPTSLAVRRND